MPVEFKLEGADAILAKLKKLPVRVGHNALRRSLRKGANVIKASAQANAKRIDDTDTREAIYKNIAVVSGGSKRERAAGGVMMRVGIRGGAKQYVNNKRNAKKGRVGESYAVGGSSLNPGGDTWYWRFVEFGTSKMKAEPFMRPAMNTSMAAAFSAIAAEMPKQLEKELAKL